MADEPRPSRYGGVTTEDFLNPNSMITPGAAGTLVALISGAIDNNFHIGYLSYWFLLFSFLMGSLVFQSNHFQRRQLGRWTKGVYFVINSFIIFAMATGSGAILDGYQVRGASLQVEGIALAQSSSREIIVQDRARYDWTKRPYIEGSANAKSDGVQLIYRVSSPSSARKSDSGLLDYFRRSGYVVNAQVRANRPVTIQKVVYHLDPRSFKTTSTTRTSRTNDFRLQLKAWRSFNLKATVYLKTGEKIVLSTGVQLGKS